MAVNSIRKRYLTKLSVSFCGSLFGLVTIGIVPRTLGPAQYGNFNFLNRTLNQFLLMLQFSSDNAFATKLSQRNNDLQLIGFYTILFLLSSAVFFSSIAISFFTDTWTALFPNQQIDNVFMAGAHVILVLLSTRLIAIADSFALTVAEWMKVVQRFTYVSLVIVATYFGMMDLKLLYVLHYISALTLIALVLTILRRN